MTKQHDTRTDTAVTVVIGTILMVALVVIMAAIIGALVMGLGGKVDKPTLTAFKVESVTNATTNKIEAVSLITMGGDTTSGQSGGSAGPGSGVKLSGLSFNMMAPGSISKEVSLCAAWTTPFSLTPGSEIFIVNRAGTFFVVNSTSATGCGGGVNPNSEFIPHGVWTIVISDTQNSNTIIYQGDVQL